MGGYIPPFVPTPFNGRLFFHVRMNETTRGWRTTGPIPLHMVEPLSLGLRVATGIQTSDDETCFFPQKKNEGLYSLVNIAGWNIPVFNRKYIFKPGPFGTIAMLIYRSVTTNLGNGWGGVPEKNATFFGRS